MNRECVLLIHGLGESALRMSLIALSLEARGFRTVSVTYPSNLHPIQFLAQHYIAPVLRAMEHEPALHVVTHSLGGILLRTCLQNYRPQNLGRVVMLAPANHGSSLLELYRRHPLFAALSGPVLQESGLGEHCFPCRLEDEVDYELGIIAGSLTLDPLALLLLPYPNDGRTSVASTRLQGMKEHITIPTTHDLITFHPFALFQAGYFIANGRFHASAYPGAQRTAGLAAPAE